MLAYSHLLCAHWQKKKCRFVFSGFRRPNTQLCCPPLSSDPQIVSMFLRTSLQPEALAICTFSMGAISAFFKHSANAGFAHVQVQCHFLWSARRFSDHSLAHHVHNCWRHCIAWPTTAISVFNATSIFLTFDSTLHEIHVQLHFWQRSANLNDSFSFKMKRYHVTLRYISISLTWKHFRSFQDAFDVRETISPQAKHSYNVRPLLNKRVIQETYVHGGVRT